MVRNPSNWDASGTQDVDDIIRGGERSFYWPPQVEGMEPHKWTFLCPTDTVSVESGSQNVDLPEDFIRLCADFTYTKDDQGGFVALASEDSVRSLRANHLTSGRPHYCAIRPKPLEVDRYELMLYPTPDSSYTFEYRYEKRPPALSSDNPYHLGSAAHSETVLAACLMVADRTLNPEKPEAAGGGLQMQRFLMALRTSILLDQQVQ
jgi:hypothetical protein